MDVQIAAVLKKKLVVQPEEEPKDLNRMKLGKIHKDNWSVPYQRKEGQKVQKCMFFLMDEHLYSTSYLNYVMELTEVYKANDAADQKCFSDMIKWYIPIRNTLLHRMHKLFKV